MSKGKKYDGSSSDRMAWLLDLNRHAGEWQEDEFKDILHHQMQAPLNFDLKRYEEKELYAAEEMQSYDPLFEKDIKTFDQLLHHPRPPLSLLKLCKRFARDNRFSAGGSLPDEVATVIYYAAVVVALGHYGERITTLSHSEIQRGVCWIMGRRWVSKKTRKLLQNALK